MARRGVMTALQAALAGIGGAAGGYVQMEERKRKQKQEEDARAQQDFLTRFSLTEAGARPRQAPVPGMAPEAPGTPPQYQSLGTFGGVEYEALTPEAKSRRDLAARDAAIAAELDVRFNKQQEQERKRLESQRPALVAALDKVDPKYLPNSIRDLVLSGNLEIDKALNVASENRRLDIAGRPSTDTPKGTYTAGEINKIIADRVADYSRFLLTSKKRVQKTYKNGTPIEGQFEEVSYDPEERAELINQYRDAVREEYKSLMPTPTGSGAGRGTGTVLPPMLDLDTLGAGGNRTSPPGAFSGGISNIGESVGQRLPQSFISDFNRAAALNAGRPAEPFQAFEYTDSLGRKFRIR